ncbi:hypothetical protein GGR58DRAFT_529470 [Xylaria digitata]|nr:hypothetical protein GGR58DRAFT_529470 [Xylaria digitata]
MAENSSTDYDLLIITDATASMDRFLIALNNSLPKIIAMSVLTDSFARIGVLAYRDYYGGKLIEWSEWYGKDGTIDRDTLIRFTKNLKAGGGSDWPEATKTALARAYSVMRSDAKTLILLTPTQLLTCLGATEQTDSDKKAQVFTISDHNPISMIPYVFMGYETSGAFLKLDGNDSNAISSLTMSILLAWLGVAKPGTNSDLGAELHTYNDTRMISSIQNELDPLAKKYFSTHYIYFMLQNCRVDDEMLRSVIKGRDTPMQNLDKRYMTDSRYRAEVTEHLGKIIEENVSSMAINPIFGSLWRAVCNDRKNNARDLLISKFGASVECITRLEQKQVMKEWLDESYNYTAEIISIIEEVAAEDRYPCVFLDPTEDWSASKGEGIDEAPTQGTGQLTHDELLEIGRSCDYRILRRLGRALTRLTYIDSEDSTPAHIKAASTEVLRMPLALAQPKYDRVLLKILLHLVCPRTKLEGRPAALLAALSIRMGVKPLMAAADAEMLNWRQEWNNLEIPETWSTGCLSLLLDADRSFEARRERGELPGNIGSFLSRDDRQLFQRLVEYSLLTANMSTTLQVRVGWQPEKAKVSIGPLVTCRKCKYPRSVTIMASGGVCGLCARDPESFARKSRDECLQANVTVGDTENSEATWVECSIQDCRAQYVIYNPELLYKHAKCYYCRKSGQQITHSTHTKSLSRKPKSIKSESGNHTPTSPTAPWIECSTCQSRVIWPHEYRPASLSVNDFRCPACLDGRDTTVTVEVMAKELAEENGTVWLLRNENNKIPDPFATRSLFKTVAASGTEDFANLVEILPASDTADLKYHGKLVCNTAEVKSALGGWICARRAEGGTCSLCFNTPKKRDLRSACGRSGCQQTICNRCRQEWYGINRRGHIINIAALYCPFCRRQPATRAVSEAARGITSLGNLRNAVDEGGSWIYAWCDSCGMAKQFMERACAQGPPPELRQWECEECKKKPDEQGVRNCPGFPDCETHWCYFCGIAVDPTEIYVHMDAEHGGWYGVENEYPDFDDED